MNHVAVLCRLCSCWCELHRNYISLSHETCPRMANCRHVLCPGMWQGGPCKQNLLQDQEREMQELWLCGVAKDLLSNGNVCLLQLALPQELLWASPFFHIIVFREMVHKGKMPIRKNEGQMRGHTEKTRWCSDPCYSNFDSSLIYCDVKSV